MRRGIGEYPADWPDLAKSVKDAADWRCVRCGQVHAPSIGRTLTVHHLDMDCGNSRWWNLLALCQACHLSIQGRVILDRPYVMLPHSEWFRVFVAGWYAWRYLGVDLSRQETEARLDELLELERQAVFA